MKNSKTIIIIAAVLIIAVGVTAVVLSRDNKIYLMILIMRMSVTAIM